jgi:hypothetical protein
MASSTKTKNQDYVKAVYWGSASPSTTITDNPTKTVWKASSTTAFIVSVTHMDNDTQQNFEGKTITVTLCDGVYTFESKD